MAGPKGCHVVTSAGDRCMVECGEDGSDGHTPGGLQLRGYGHSEVTAIRLYTTCPTIAGCYCITCQNFVIVRHIS